MRGRSKNGMNVPAGVNIGGFDVNSLFSNLRTFGIVFLDFSEITDIWWIIEKQKNVTRNMTSSGR
jgi:hypothetical protein